MTGNITPSYYPCITSGTDTRSSKRCIEVIAGVLGRAGQSGRRTRLAKAEKGEVTYNMSHTLVMPEGAKDDEDDMWFPDDTIDLTGNEHGGKVRFAEPITKPVSRPEDAAEELKEVYADAEREVALIKERQERLDAAKKGDTKE
jgi:hypothetical protein